MPKCPRCGWKYDDTIQLSPLVGSLTYSRVPICAPCAMDVRANIHGIRLPFQPGSVAEEIYNATIEYRRTHHLDGSKR